MSLHLTKYTYWDVFSTAQNSFWTHWFWCLFVSSAVFFFSFFHIGKMFHFEDFLFFARETKNVTQGEMRWIGRVGHGDHAVFGQKLLNIQCCGGRYACKSPIMQWANVLKESSKKIHEAEHSLSHNDTGFLYLGAQYWYRWVPRTLT